MQYHFKFIRVCFGQQFSLHQQNHFLGTLLRLLSSYIILVIPYVYAISKFLDIICSNKQGSFSLYKILNLEIRQYEEPFRQF